MEYRTYKYQLYPTNTQEPLINHIIECCAFIRKQFQNDLKDGIEFPEKYKEILAYYIGHYNQLKDCDNSALMHEIFDVRDEEHKEIIRIANSYTTSYLPYYEKNFPLQDRKIFLPKVGWVKKSKNRPIQEGFKVREFVVFRKEDKYYLLIKITLPSKEIQPLNPDRIIGLDYSSTHFVVDSDNGKYDIPHFYRDEMKKIAELQKELLCHQKGSYRSKVIINQIRKMHHKIQNRRKDYLHKLSSEFAKEYDYIAIETLQMKEMTEWSNLANATYDNSYYKFTDMLEYKMRQQNKKLIKVDRWYPSTKKCCHCGYINQKINLKTKIWICPKCLAILDRDYNAAVNIRNEGKRMIKAGG